MRTIAIPVFAGLVCTGAFWLFMVNPNAVPAVNAPDVVDRQAPEFVEITEWLNEKPLKMADLKKSVVVVHFWTNGCINCVHNYPHYRKWMEQFKDHRDFRMVGVHTPEFDGEKSISRLKDRIRDNKLTFAVAVDNSGATWKAWGNEYRPCVYLVDKSGKVREKWNGELGDKGFAAMTARIEALLKE